MNVINIIAIIGTIISVTATTIIIYKFLKDNNFCMSRTRRRNRISPEMFRVLARIIEERNQQLSEIELKSRSDNISKNKFIVVVNPDNKIVLGIPELMIYTISNLHKKHPYFFGKILENNFFENSLNPNIGITLDIGKGLFIPVIKESNKLTIKDIAKQLTLFKLKALRNSFKNAIIIFYIIQV